MYSQNQVWQQKKISNRDRVESKLQSASHYEPSYSAAPYRPSSRASSVPAYSRDVFRQDTSTTQTRGFQKRPSCTSALNTIITNFHDISLCTSPSNSNQSIVRTIPIQRSAEYLASRTQMKKFPLRDGPLPPSSVTLMQSKQMQSSPSSTLQSKPLYQQQQQKSSTNGPSRSASSERTNSLPRTHLNSVMTISLLPGSAKQSSVPSEAPAPRVGKKPAYSRSQSNTCSPNRFLQSDAETVTSVNSETMSVNSEERIKIPEDRRSFIRKSPSLRVGQSSDRSVATYPGGNHPLPKRSSLDVLLTERQSSADSLGKPNRMQVGPTFPGTVARTSLCSPIVSGSVRTGRTSVNPVAQLPPQHSLTDSSHSSEQVKLVRKNSEEPHGILKNSKFRFSLPRMRSNAPVLTDMGGSGDSANRKAYPLRNASSYTSISEKSDIKPMTEIRFERPIRKRVSPKRSGYQTDVDHLNSTNSEDSLTVVRNLPLSVRTIESGPCGTLNHRRIGNSSNPVSPLYSGQGMKDNPRSGSRSLTEAPRSATSSTESSRPGRSIQKSPINLVHISSDPASPRNLSTRSNRRDSVQNQPLSSPTSNINTSGLSQPNQKFRSSRSSSRESTNVISKSAERNNLTGSINTSPERKQSPYKKSHGAIYYENPISMTETGPKGTVRLASTGTRPTILDSRSSDTNSRTITIPSVGHVDKIAPAQLSRPGPTKLVSSTSNDNKAKLSPFRKTSDCGLSTLNPMVDRKASVEGPKRGSSTDPGPKRKNTQVSFNLDQNQCVEFSHSDKPAIPAKRIQGYISSTGAAPGEGTQLSRPIPTRSARVRDLHPLGWASRFPARFPGTGQGQNSWPRMNLTHSIDLAGKSSTTPTRSSGMTKSPPPPTRAGCRDDQSPVRAGLVFQPTSLRTLSPHKSQPYQNSLYQNGRESQLFSDVEFCGSAPRTSFDQPPFRQEIQHQLPVDMFHRIP